MIDAGHVQQERQRHAPHPAPPLTSVLVVDEAHRAHLAFERAEFLRLSEGRRLEAIDWQGGNRGDTADRILQLAAEQSADLIVLGRERSPLRVRLFGSTAEKLACMGGSAVLLARQHPARPYRRVLVATDFSKVAADAVNFARRLLPRQELEFRVLNAYDTSYLLVLRQANTPLEQQLAWCDELRARAEKDMDGFLRPLEASGHHVDSVLVAGDPQKEIRKTAEAWDADLVVLGKSGVGQTLLGSVASTCMRRLHCDVLVVPPKASH